MPSSSSSTSAVPASSKSVDAFKSSVEKQKSTWECSACLSANDISKSKCACCEQSRDVTKGATTSGALPAKSQFSFGSAATSAPKSTFSFGSLPGTTAAATPTSSTAVSTAPKFPFGSDAAKTTPSASFSFGNLKKPETASSNGKTEEDKAKESVQKPTVSAQISFGNTITLPSTSKKETTPKPAAPVETDNVFKSIVEKQKNSSWECSACMSKNSNDTEKCACCETPKDGSAPKDSSSKTEFGSLASSQKFSFGSTSGSTFSFGLKPDNKPSFPFGSVASSTTAVVTSTVTSTTSSVFGSSSQASTFSFKPTTTEPAAAVTGQSAVLAGFKFGFGSASTTTPIFGTKDASKDETDTGPSVNANSEKGVTVLENVLVKPATSGPGLFSFGQNVTKPATDDVKAQKRPNTEQADNNILAKLPATTATSNTPFVFGQPQNTSNTFSAIASSPAANVVSQESTTAPAAQKPSFTFGMNKQSTSAFPTAQPTFGNQNAAVTPFSFTANNTTTAAASSPFGAPAAAPALTTPSQPVFGSNAFSSQSSAIPTLGGFKTGSTFGSSAPAFGTPSPNTEVRIHLLFFFL